jgi:hypothetical protein
MLKRSMCTSQYIYTTVVSSKPTFTPDELFKFALFRLYMGLVKSDVSRPVSSTTGFQYIRFAHTGKADTIEHACAINLWRDHNFTEHFTVHGNRPVSTAFPHEHMEPYEFAYSSKFSLV